MKLKAELGAALVCYSHGISKGLKEDSAAYLKSWLDNLQESPDFIKNVMSDVKKAVAVVNYRLEEIGQRLEAGLPIEPYNREMEALDPTLAPEEAPFKGKAAEVAAMGTPKGFRQVDICSMIQALYEKGETKLSDHFIPEEKSEQKEQESEEQSEDTHRGRGR